MTDKVTSATELIEDLYGFLALLPRLNRAERAGFTTYTLTHSDDYRGDSHIIFDFEDYAGTHGGYKIKVSGVAGGMYDDIVFSNLGSDDIDFEVVKSTLKIHVKYYDMRFTIDAGLYQYNRFDCWDYEPEDENGERKCTREPMFEIDSHSIFIEQTEGNDEEWHEFKEAQKAEERAMDDWEAGREAGWDDWEEAHYGGTQ